MRSNIKIQESSKVPPFSSHSHLKFPTTVSQQAGGLRHARYVLTRWEVAAVAATASIVPIEAAMRQLLENMATDLSSVVSWVSLYLSIAICIRFLVLLSGDTWNGVLVESHDLFLR